jgi:hypothetical protein
MDPESEALSQTAGERSYRLFLPPLVNLSIPLARLFDKALDRGQKPFALLGQ